MNIHLYLGIEGLLLEIFNPCHQLLSVPVKSLQMMCWKRLCKQVSVWSAVIILVCVSAINFAGINMLCSPYLNLAVPHWFDSELPVVGYFHDFDVSAHGLELVHEKPGRMGIWPVPNFLWISGNLSNILIIISSVSENEDQCQLNLFSENNPPFIKPIRIGIHIPGKTYTTKIFHKQ